MFAEQLSLYPNPIRDLIDFSLRDCIAKNVPVRRCRNCGRYFPIIGRITKDLVFSEYRREYKRHFAWIKAGKISEEQFSAWAKQAKTKKHECDAEQISLDEFKAWLKNL